MLSEQVSAPLCFHLTEISFWSRGVSDRTGMGGGGLRYHEEGGEVKPPETWLPDSGPKPVRVYISPLSSGKLARLMLRQRVGGADGVSRWPSGIGGSGIGGSGIGASQRGLRPPARVYESCKIVSGLRPRGPVSSSLGHLVIRLSHKVACS